MPLSLYADECLDARTVAGLRRRSIDIQTTADEALLGAPDERQLAQAIARGRVVVTNDQDFLRLAHDRMEKGLPFPGVIFVLPGTPVGDAVRAIADLAVVLDAYDMAGRIEWVP